VVGELRESSINYLKRHRDLRQADILLAQGISEDDLLLPENEKVRRIRRMIREVGTEYHYLKSFIRFEEPRRGILVGYASPKHRIKQMLADHFAHRFPGNLIVVGDERSFCLSLLSERGRLRVEVKGSIKVLRRELGCGGREDEGSVLWESYYFSQYEPRRRNLGMFKRRMPERYRREVKLKLKSTPGNVTLDDFLKNKEEECSGDKDISYGLL